MAKVTESRARIWVPLVVSGILGVFLVLGYLTTRLIGVPESLSLPLPIRVLGLLLVALGCAFLGWLFKHRKPIDIVVSTYVTLLKVRRSAHLEERAGRAEALVIAGPYQYVRHPLYFGVVALVLGGALQLDSSVLLCSAALLLLWFNFVVAPFEERELLAVFGDQYKRYTEHVPKLVPFTKRRKVTEPTTPVG